MYKNILLPTDGSALSRQAVAAGIALAGSLGASVVGMHVLPQLRKDQLEAWMHHDPDHARHWQALLDKFADDYLKVVTEAAQAAHVHCVCCKETADNPSAAIVHAAKVRHCDLIYIGSHGLSDDSSGMLGSVTMKVLHESSVPVLVHKVARPAPAAR